MIFKPILFCFCAPIASASVADPPSSAIATVSSQQFASESSPLGRVDFQGVLRSDTTIQVNGDETLPARELHFYSFFETDQRGNRSFDADSMAIRLSPFEGSHLWLGRSHPLMENNGDEEPRATSAIGANWVQNQSDPLRPRVSGWLGTGAHFYHEGTGLFGTASFSPLFLPNFGPSVQFSEESPPSGPRFSHLPPTRISMSGRQLPLYYRIDVGDVRAIVLQPQYFLALGHESSLERLTLMHWSAPAPNPRVSASGVLRVNAQDAAVLVAVSPSFPREHFFGAQWAWKTAAAAFVSPVFETVYEKISERITFSASSSFGKNLEAGYLTSWKNPQQATGDTPSTDSADYADHLFWIELNGEGLIRKLRPSLRIERHLAPSLGDQWIFPRIQYWASDRVSLFAAASILTGTYESYLGGWRDLDSVSAGGQFRW